MDKTCEQGKLRSQDQKHYVSLTIQIRRTKNEFWPEPSSSQTIFVLTHFAKRFILRNT